MIITRTPFRISFFGGGTDYPSWFEFNGGHVISAAIDKYSYILLRELPPFFSFKNRIRYFSEENTQSISEISHPVVREAAQFLQIPNGFEVVHTADLPARSGLGSSSAFAVGILHAFARFKRDHPSKRDLAQNAIHVEQVLVAESVGSQDQVAAAYGGFNSIRFDSTGFEVESLSQVPVLSAGLQDHVMLCFTGHTRTASDLAAQQIARTKSNTRLLQEISSISSRVYESILDGTTDFQYLGTLLDEQWNAKKQLGPGISMEEIDGLYHTARRLGAWGGKLLGAGGGGFMIFIAPPDSHDRIMAGLSQYLFVPFNFDFEGSKVVYESE